MTNIQYQRGFYADLSGDPLDSGSLYLGVANQDPQTHPISAFWDSALSVPAAQPLTISSGYVVNNGVRSAVYVSPATYSLRVLNRAGTQVDYIAEANDEAAANDAAIRSDLASTSSAKGAGLSGFSQSAVYATKTVGSKIGQTVSPLDDPYNAAGDASTDDLNAINSAIAAAANKGEVNLAGATYRVSASPTNNRGVQLTNGNVVIGTGSAAYAVNSYTRGFDFVHGRGNHYALKNAINTAGTSWNAYFYGDSTVATTGNGGIPGGSYTPDVLLAQHMREHGVRNVGTFTNRAVGGTNWSNANPVPDLGANTKLLVFKYAVNHVSGQDIDAEISAMRTVLAAVRAASNGSWDKVTILLVGPNSTHDTAGGRTSLWYEKLRNAYVQAAWDYGCVYVDLYGLFPDSTRWAGYYADTPAVHVQSLLLQEMWAYVGNAVLPSGGLQISTGSRWVPLSFQNSWASYDNGFKPLQVSLKEDGRVFLVGGTAPPGGTITASQVIASLPNTNYYSNRSVLLTGWTFDGTNYATLPCGTDTGGTIYARKAATGITALLFDSESWQTW